MRKVQIQCAGSYEQLAIVNAPERSPGPGEVAIDVSAIGVNYADCVVRMGLYSSAKKYVGWPITPGFEVSGHVAATGANASRFEVGQPVLAVTRFDGYATHLVVPEHQVFPLPARLSMVQAASFPSVFLTAWFALFELAHPHAGDDALVHSAAGGVGCALSQLASGIAGCRVVGVVGASHKTTTALNQGCAAVIDKSTQSLWKTARKLTPNGYHHIFDANGVSTLGKSFAHLAAPGKLVVYGFHSMLPRKGGRPQWLRLARDFLRTPRFSPLSMTEHNRSVLAFNLSYLFDEHSVLERAMRDLLGWLEEERIHPLPVTTYPFERVADAHRALESAQTTGKLVLVV